MAKVKKYSAWVRQWIRDKQANVPFFVCNGINVLPINNRTGHLFLFIVVVKKSKVRKSLNAVLEVLL